MSQIRAAIDDIKAVIQAAQSKSTVASENVLLLAVTKNVDVDRINEALSYGISAIGENRVQELLNKYGQIKPNISWHLIGHLQTNKVRYIIDKICLIHSLDSIPLANEINKRAGLVGRVMPVLVQVNVADEDTKYGVKLDDAIPFIKEVMLFPHIKIQGLMTIGPFVENPEEVRPVFRELRELRNRIKQMGLPGVEMNYLSMGMTNDYQIAVEEGANIVRIGSGIFGKRGV